MSNISRVRCLEFSFLPATSLDLTLWTPLWEALDEQCFLIRITNASLSDVFVSYDPGYFDSGLGRDIHEDNDIVLHDDYIEIYGQNNASYSEKTANFPKGMPIYVRGVPGAGYLVATGYTYVNNN